MFTFARAIANTNTNTKTLAVFQRVFSTKTILTNKDIQKFARYLFTRRTTTNQLLEMSTQRPKRSAKSLAGNAKIARTGGGGGSIADNLNSSTTTKSVPSINNRLELGEMEVDASVEILEAPVKSESDTKSYRVIKLPNGLKAVLISDPSPIEAKSAPEASTVEDETEEEESSDEEDGDDDDEVDDEHEDEHSESKEKLAACSLCIDVGSFSDPRDIEGLAHFLEHMIFMGSEKYPSENEFDQYIKKCGGSDNAHTNCEETQFYFEVGEEHLDGALDRFASLFRNPLMLKDAMTRERDAVESEFVSKGQDDAVRREQLMVSIAQPDHPSSIFTWGNQKTLKENIDDEHLHARVHDFRRRHYSSHRMYLSIQARMPLDVLQELVIKHWSDMPNNGLAGDDMSRFNNKNAFKDEFSSKLFLFKPVANSTKLEVTFCLPSLLNEYKAKSHHFIAYLLGHEGTGSLCAYLRNKLYGLDLVAGVEDVGFESNTLYSMFTITVYLTQFGLDNVRDVLAAVFGYIRFMKAAGPQERLYREIQQIEENGFRFKTDQTAEENVEELAVNLKYYPTKYLYTADALYMDYQPDGIAGILDAMTDPETPMNIMITSAQSFNGNKFDRVEPWFGSEYATIDFPAGWKELRTEAEILPEFGLPPPNPFISTNFDILFKKDVTKITDYPVKAFESPIGEMWFRQDGRFLLPVSYYYLYLKSPNFRGSTENFVMAALYPMLLKFKLIERLYPATIAGLAYECYASEKGLVIRVNGYSQNLHRILETLAESLATFADEVTEEQFRTMVEQKLREYYNIILKPKSFAKILRFNIVEHEFVPTIEKFEFLKHVNLEQFRKFAGEFRRQMHVQALFQGNLDTAQAVSIMKNLMDKISCKPIVDDTILKLRANTLPTGSSYLRCPSMNEMDANTVTVNYYQIGPISIRLNCLIDMMLLIAEEPAFDMLRSKEQLGYDVGCGIRDNYGILGYTISVVSAENKFSSEHIDDRIEAFRAEFVDIVRKLTSDDFNQFRETLIKLKMTDDNHLRDELTRNWAEVTSDEYIFDRHLKEVECIKTITQEEFVQFYVEHFATGTRKLCVQVIGNGTMDANGEQTDVVPKSIFETSFKPISFVEFTSNPDRGALIRGVTDFRSNLTAYPVSKTIL